MINPLSNQSYNYQYATGQIAPPANTAPVSRPQTEGSLLPVDAIASKKTQDIGPKECKTWSARKYKDQSSDSSVSFQAPSHVSPDMAAEAVISHEEEHVQHNAETARREGMKATSFVQIHTAVCPEWGRIYVSGGSTTTYYSRKELIPGDESKGFYINIKA